MENFKPPNEFRNRRHFLKKIAIGSLGLGWMSQVLASPYQNLISDFSPLIPVRIKGRIHNGGSGIMGVSVSDGLNVTQTNRDGSFELVSSGERPFVWVSIPSGYEIPRSTEGIASFYKRIDSHRDSMDIQWELQKLKGGDRKHGFLVMADPQTLDVQDMGRYLNETIPDVKGVLANNQMPFFNLSCGDIMYDHLEFYKDYKKGVEQ